MNKKVFNLYPLISGNRLQWRSDSRHNMMTYTKTLNATFISEIKNRFLCDVNVEGHNIRCYVPSSCRLENLIDLKGLPVLLLPTVTSTAKVPYSVFAVKYRRSYIVLNSSAANTFVQNRISSRCFSALGKRTRVCAEKQLVGYKCDFFIEDTNTIIEVKSIITSNIQGIFPTVFSQRALNQLQHIKMHLQTGKPAAYILVALSPYIKSIKIERDSAFSDIFRECIELGLQIMAFSCRYKEGQLLMEKRLQIIQ